MYLVDIIHRKMMISLDEEVFERLYRTVGQQKMSQFIEELLRQHVVDRSVDKGYQAMETVKKRETTSYRMVQLFYLRAVRFIEVDVDFRFGNQNSW
jgi:histone H3/H4